MTQRIESGLDLEKQMKFQMQFASLSSLQKKEPFKINIIGHTIPHEVVGKFKSLRSITQTIFSGTGIIAGESVRSVVEKAGVQDILTKSYGSGNPLNIVRATFKL